jgi:hypothetical protein
LRQALESLDSDRVLKAGGVFSEPLARSDHVRHECLQKIRSVLKRRGRLAASKQMLKLAFAYHEDPNRTRTGDGLATPKEAIDNAHESSAPPPEYASREALFHGSLFRVSRGRTVADRGERLG